MASTKPRSTLSLILLGLAVPISLYVTVLGTVFMGFCSGLACLPHTFAWTLLAPSLLLALWSIRASAIVTVVLFIAHALLEGGLRAVWGSDGGLDTCFVVVILLLIVSALRETSTAKEAL